MVKKKKNIITEEHAAFLFPACKFNHLSGYWTVGWGKSRKSGGITLGPGRL